MLRVGLIGAGANTRSRHIPGLLALPDVKLTAVCNRRPESTQDVAREFGIPHTFERWQALVACEEVDAIVIGTWPYLHAPITLAALEANKHVLTEARMAMNATEARAMLAASQTRPQVVCQIVPSPFGLVGDTFVKNLLLDGYLGEPREVSVVHRAGTLADPTAPLHWRQDAALSGVNMLTLGILHETLSRWLPQPVRVLAQCHAFTSHRTDPASGQLRAVGTPDSVQVLTELPGGARGCYQFSAAVPFGGEMAIRLYGTRGALEYDLGNERLRGMKSATEWVELEVPAEMRGGWNVEADWVGSIREGKPVRYTTFEEGVSYMEFTEAVARSAASGAAVRVGGG